MKHQDPILEASYTTTRMSNGMVNVYRGSSPMRSKLIARFDSKGMKPEDAVSRLDAIITQHLTHKAAEIQRYKDLSGLFRASLLPDGSVVKQRRVVH